MLFVTGSVYPEVERKLPQYPYKTPRVLFRNLGNGTFEELESQAGPGISTPHGSRGCAFGDFDNDGDIDVLIVNMNEPPSLLRNDLNPMQHWIKIKTGRSEIQSQRHRRQSADALRRQGSGSGDAEPVQLLFLQRSPPAFWPWRREFRVDVEVFWPNGLHEGFKKIAVNQLITLREGVGIVNNRGWNRT